MTLGVWAGHSEASRVCADARLHGGDGNLVEYYSVGPHSGPIPAPVRVRNAAGDYSIWGQSGWDVGIVYSTLADLAQKIRAGAARTIRSHEITHLAINCHGADWGGDIAIEGTQSEHLTTENVANFQTRLAPIVDFLAADALVAFMGCTVAVQARGLQLLAVLSGPGYFENRTVVAFTRVGIGDGHVRALSGGTCHEAGMRISDIQMSHSEEVTHLDDMEWAGQGSRHSVVARGGRIVSSWDVDVYPHTPEGEREAEAARQRLLEQQARANREAEEQRRQVEAAANDPVTRQFFIQDILLRHPERLNDPQVLRWYPELRRYRRRHRR